MLFSSVSSDIFKVKMDCVGVERPSEILKLTGWSRKVTGHGVVYYVRRGTNESR